MKAKDSDGIYMICADSFHDKNDEPNFYITNGQTVNAIHGNAFFSKRQVIGEEMVYVGLSREDAERVLEGFNLLPTLDMVFDTTKIN